VDPKLSAYLLSKGMHANVYAFASVLTMCACTPPLPEVLHLWDFLLAYGPHLNILCIVAQLIMMRDDILQSPRSVAQALLFLMLLILHIVLRKYYVLSHHFKPKRLKESPSVLFAKYRRIYTMRLSSTQSSGFASSLYSGSVNGAFRFLGVKFIIWICDRKS
jgi:Rab-GTPase-TBC domain